MVSNKVLNPRLGEDNRCSFIIISCLVTVLVNIVNSFIDIVILRNVLGSVSEVNIVNLVNLIIIIKDKVLAIGFITN